MEQAPEAEPMKLGVVGMGSIGCANGIARRTRDDPDRQLPA